MGEQLDLSLVTPERLKRFWGGGGINFLDSKLPSSDGRFTKGTLTLKSLYLDTLVGF